MPLNFPTPDEWAKSHGYNRFPKRWAQWLGAIRASILALERKAGKNVTISEFPGKGTVINVERRPVGAAAPTGACCLDGNCTIRSSLSCAVIGGIYQGDDTICDPNPCPPAGTGACCYNNGTCDDGLTATQCAEGGGIYQGNGSICAGVECFNCASGVDLAFCADWTVSCTAGDDTADCPCFFSIGWADSCCNTPPAIQCGSSEPTPSGSCNCTGYTPEPHSAVQAYSFVESGICKVHIFINLVPQCSRPGFPVCSIPLGADYDYNYDDHSATITDTLTFAGGSCTFTLTVTW